ncbi:MAG: exonuclease SbcCD subunit D [Oscillospiraceae bacterium]
MKLLHISDLHIGRVIYGFDMTDDQEFILSKIIHTATVEKVDAVLVAGDVYDKSIPSARAVEILDKFITELSEKGISVYMISGNHDGRERLSFGSRLMSSKGVMIYSNFDGELKKFTHNDLFGTVNIYMLPFVRPENVKQYYPDDKIETYDDAVRAIISHAEINRRERNVLIAHQFVTNSGAEPVRCESEQITIGGLDNVDASVFDCFDYVALGHIHSAQSIGRDCVRYAGTPLKYSLSEIKQTKSVTIVGIEEKGNVTIDKIPVSPKRDMRMIKGRLSDLMKTTISLDDEDYIYAVLTDDDELYDAVGKLRSIYPNLIHIDFDNKRTAHNAEIAMAESLAEKSPEELFAEFYLAQNGTELTEEKLAVVRKAFEEGATDL